eukprot:CAMPEP_0198493186 /NCGR_PEP_ID=MMETSP1462-20131121/3869_1 /TAXON_ID=1333877 /ORGANISM="Brandtodinium nutriculum, Strain RCC3387" /LENGTH=34 /DNA_ID= /DNA_START= /DNA_END= /DNA_ORIENTATION=
MHRAPEWRIEQAEGVREHRNTPSFESGRRALVLR